MKILGIILLTVSGAAFAGSLSEELAVERGIKLAPSDPLGSNKSTPLKAEILGCGGQPLQSKLSALSSTKNQPAKGLGGNTASLPQDELSLEKMKEQLINASRLASNSRYQASLAGMQKKKTCNINLAE